MNNIKILVSDYDQTFYLNDEDIEKNKIAINKFREEGNLLLIWKPWKMHHASLMLNINNCLGN